MIINLIDNPDAFRPSQLNENYPLDVNTSYIDGHTSASASFEVLFKKNIDNARYDKYSYQWYKDGDIIDDATSKELQIDNISEECSYGISCKVVNKAGRETASRLAMLNVERYYLPVLDGSYPADVRESLAEGEEVTSTFNVVISEHGYPSGGYVYKWYVDNELQPETGSTFQITCAECTETITKTVYCEVYLSDNDSACVRSKDATYTVTPAVYLFNSGDIADLTGGWNMRKHMENESAGMGAQGSFSYSNGILNLTVVRPNANNYYGCTLYQRNLLPIESGFTTLCIVWGDCTVYHSVKLTDSDIPGADSYYTICNNDTATGKVTTLRDKTYTAPSGTERFDISGITNLKLEFKGVTHYYRSSPRVELNIKQIWLE